MSAKVILGKAIFSIADADRLCVDGELVQIQRSTVGGFETVAVAGEDLLVTIEPVEWSKVEFRTEEKKEEPAAAAASSNGPLWLPVGEPLD